MADRQITFIDTDDNPLIVRLKEDRAQLVVVDGEPELEAAELRGFATALFAAYVGGPLARRLAASCDKIDRVREHLARTGGADELVAALDGSLRVIADIADAMTAATAAVSSSEEPAPQPTPKVEYRVAAALRKSRRRPRISEGCRPTWGASPVNLVVAPAR
jgi:hypothetical protein